MDVETTRAVDQIRPITRQTDARAVGLAVYARLFDVLERLEPDQWDARTDCSRWDVADVVGHMIGAAKACASVRELARQQRWGRRHADEFDNNALDAFNELQVREHADLSPTQMIAALRQVAPAAVRGRLRLPSPLRRISLALDQGGSTPPGMPARFSIGHLMDVIYTRDTWLHTIDIVRATSSPYEPDPRVDGRVVEDVVAEWAKRHGEPFVLVLDGPAGGRFRHGRGGNALRMDAIDFCRVLSGRADPTDVEGPATPAADRLLRTRILF